MKPLQWDLMSVAERYRTLHQWDCEDFGGRAKLVDLEWRDLPIELRMALKGMQ